MFGIGSSELVVIVIIVFLIYRPERLPEVIRKVTKFIREIRQVSEDVTGVIRREVNNMEVMTKYPNETETPLPPHTEVVPEEPPVVEPKKTVKAKKKPAKHE